MRDKLLLVGAGGFGRVVSELARQSYDCAFVDDGVEVGSIVCDIPVVGCTVDLQKLFAEYKNLVIVIGNNTVRERIYDIAKKINWIHFSKSDQSECIYQPICKAGLGMRNFEQCSCAEWVDCRKWCAA